MKLKPFKQYLIESGDKNTHLEHLEDEIFNHGVPGARGAVSFLRGLRNMLSGSSKSSVNVTVKWDGAPAVICGTNPENGKFFVATKSAFNKSPKLNYTHKDIEENHSGKTELVDKLKICLDNLAHLGIKGVLQGDLLFTKGDIAHVEHNGEKLITFTPNTITYAVPANSDIAAKILGANMGIVFHTTYSGKSVESMKASFGANIRGLKGASNVWVTDANFRDESGSATLTKAETVYVTQRISEIVDRIGEMDQRIISQIISNEEIKSFIKMYVNSNVRVGQNISGTKKYARGLTSFISDKYQEQIDKLKTEKGKEGRLEKLKFMLKFIKQNETQFVLMFLVSALLADVKGTLLAKLKRVNSIGTFLETPNGFKVTSPEGFVVVDHLGKALKLVDRLEFSRANFSQDD
jgi:Family of unknown function (DUF6267)